MELNWDTLCSHRFSRECIRYAPGAVDGIKLRLSAFIEGDVEKKKIKSAMHILL